MLGKQYLTILIKKSVTRIVDIKNAHRERLLNSYNLPIEETRTHKVTVYTGNKRND